MTDVTIYAAPLPEGPEASHRLLRRPRRWPRRR